MLTRWWLPLHGIVPRGVTPTYVHAAVSRLFDTTDDDHRANRKAYTISPAADGPGGPGIEVGTLTGPYQSEPSCRRFPSAAPWSRSAPSTPSPAHASRATAVAR